jgi:hypothetical protein
MAIITKPNLLRTGRLSIGQMRYDLDESSDSTGEQAGRLLGPPRWMLSIASPEVLPTEDAVVWESLLLRLRGRNNHFAMYDEARPVPRGTMRGALTLSGAHAAGATSLVITGGAGQAAKTLLTGDWMQVGTGVGTSQLVKAMADSTANGSGVITVQIEPPLRRAFGSGAGVTWDRPVTYYKAAASMSQWEYVTTYLQSGFAFDGLESWTP